MRSGNMLCKLGLFLFLLAFLSGSTAIIEGSRGWGERAFPGGDTDQVKGYTADLTTGCVSGVTGSEWMTEQVDTSRVFLEMRDNSLGLDMDGHPHIAYGGDHLYYAFHDGVAWRIETVDWSENVGIYASLELDLAGYPHIAYYDRGLNQLKYAHFDGVSWEIQVVDPDDGMS